MSVLTNEISTIAARPAHPSISMPQILDRPEFGDNVSMDHLDALEARASTFSVRLLRAEEAPAAVVARQGLQRDDSGSREKPSSDACRSRRCTSTPARVPEM